MATRNPKPETTPDPTPSGPRNQSPAPGPATTPPAAVSPPPQPAASPTPKPARARPPTPEVAQRPKIARPANAPGTAAQDAVEAPKPEKTLPADPAAREAELSRFNSEADFGIQVLDMLASRLPPEKPLSDEEKAMIRAPLREVLWKYDGAIPCEWQLGIAIISIGLPRYMEWKKSKGPEKAKTVGEMAGAH